jgi:hypothetical protein
MNNILPIYVQAVKVDLKCFWLLWYYRVIRHFQIKTTAIEQLKMRYGEERERMKDTGIFILVRGLKHVRQL